MNTITLIVGNLKFDKTRQTDICCNLTNNELEDAFRKGEEIIGIRFNDQFSDYGSYELPVSMIKKMSKFFDTGFDDLTSEDEDAEYIDCREYLHLWLKIAKVGNPKLDYEFCKSNPSLYIGGYGLFE